MSEQTALNILSVLDGEPIRQNVINQDVLAAAVELLPAEIGPAIRR